MPSLQNNKSFPEPNWKPEWKWKFRLQRFEYKRRWSRRSTKDIQQYWDLCLGPTPAGRRLPLAYGSEALAPKWRLILEKGEIRAWPAKQSRFAECGRFVFLVN